MPMSHVRDARGPSAILIPTLGSFQATLDWGQPRAGFDFPKIEAISTPRLFATSISFARDPCHALLRVVSSDLLLASLGRRASGFAISCATFLVGAARRVLVSYHTDKTEYGYTPHCIRIRGGAPRRPFISPSPLSNRASTSQLRNHASSKNHQNIFRCDNEHSRTTPSAQQPQKHDSGGIIRLGRSYRSPKEWDCPAATPSSERPNRKKCIMQRNVPMAQIRIGIGYGVELCIRARNRLLQSAQRSDPERRAGSILARPKQLSSQSDPKLRTHS
ncbi:hypothetical protein Cob_v008623 [Colletotrichum orbiculare MAFF 240422]|uniref:Uncharacterized protein n=1 Tax=Colletotrichum orbiculare (strain 104-T / ATCC 96160 / CBS 514.97 / LARS 414 / MAFF 240422) TaxID=1213857 RepID=A0A484FNP3_COLOR|nr:hypothetical protein Cob_v008623 [Colletotrichum orbiculare MAFF 240422]